VTQNKQISIDKIAPSSMNGLKNECAGSFMIARSGEKSEIALSIFSAVLLRCLSNLVIWHISTSLGNRS
jgi:hypothetical protein